MKELVVGMGDVKCAGAEYVLATYALGSCVGVCIYDEATGVGGLLHAMLPFSKNGMELFQQARYVDTGIKRLVQEISHRGGMPSRLRAKLVGGAKMFGYQSLPNGQDIGQNNVRQVYKELQALNIPIVAEVTGGETSRTIYFTPRDGSVRIVNANRTQQII